MKPYKVLVWNDEAIITSKEILAMSEDAAKLKVAQDQELANVDFNTVQVHVAPLV